MKNKRKIIILLVAIVIIFLIIGFVLIPKNNNQSKINKGYEIFGDKYCNCHSMFEVAGDAFTSWTCKICGHKGENPDTNVPMLCSECANITGRCHKCGNLLQK